VEELDNFNKFKERVAPRFEVIDIVHTDQGGSALSAKEGGKGNEKSKRPRITARSTVAIVINSSAVLSAFRTVV